MDSKSSSYDSFRSSSADASSRTSSDLSDSTKAGKGRSIKQKHPNPGEKLTTESFEAKNKPEEKGQEESLKLLCNALSSEETIQGPDGFLESIQFINGVESLKEGLGSYDNLPPLFDDQRKAEIKKTNAYLKSLNLEKLSMLLDRMNEKGADTNAFLGKWIDKIKQAQIKVELEVSSMNPWDAISSFYWRNRFTEKIDFSINSNSISDVVNVVLSSTLKKSEYKDRIKEAIVEGFLQAKKEALLKCNEKSIEEGKGHYDNLIKQLQDGFSATNVKNFNIFKWTLGMGPDDLAYLPILNILLIHQVKAIPQELNTAEDASIAVMFLFGIRHAESLKMNQSSFSQEIIKDLPVVEAKIEAYITKNENNAEELNELKRILAEKKKDYDLVGFSKSEKAILGKIEEPADARRIASLDRITVQKSGLTEAQTYALVLLGEHSGVRSPSKKAFLYEFLKNSYNNSSLYKTLSKIEKQSPIPDGLELSTIKDIKKLIFKANKQKALVGVLNKSENIVQLMQAGKATSSVPGQKLKLNEAGLLLSFSKLSKYLEKLEDVIPDSKATEADSFYELYQNARKAYQFYKKINEHFQESAKSYYFPGDVLAENISKARKVRMGDPSFLEKVVAKTITKYGHAAKIHTANKGSSVRMSEVMDRHISYDMDFMQGLKNTTFRFNFEKLVTKEGQAALKEKYGENEWKHVVEQFYISAERKLHEKKDRKIVNDSSRQHAAGLADFKFRGHKKKDSFKPEALRDAFYSEEKREETMICSEFAAKSSAAALEKLNDVLKEELGLGDDVRVIKVPFSKNENLDKIHPERLIKKLKDLVDEIPPPKFLTDYFDI